jgi:hypothetical protein
MSYDNWKLESPDSYEDEESEDETDYCDVCRSENALWVKRRFKNIVENKCLCKDCMGAEVMETFLKTCRTLKYFGTFNYETLKAYL